MNRSRLITHCDRLLLQRIHLTSYSYKSPTKWSWRKTLRSDPRQPWLYGHSDAIRYRTPGGRKRTRRTGVKWLAVSVKLSCKRIWYLRRTARLVSLSHSGQRGSSSNMAEFRFLLICEGSSDSALVNHIERLLIHCGATGANGSSFHHGQYLRDKLESALTVSARRICCSFIGMLMEAERRRDIQKSHRKCWPRSIVGNGSESYP